MDRKLLAQLKEISQEEEEYLKGKHQVKKKIYTTKTSMEIDRNLFLQNGGLVTVRPHSRFIDFPEHRHNYIEIMYVCQGSITHFMDGKEVVLKKGDMLFLNQNVRHRVKRAEYEDIGINFIALPEFFDIPLQMLHKNNLLAEFLVSTLRQNQAVSHYLVFQLGEDRAIENLMENMMVSILSEEKNEDMIIQYSMGLVFLYLLDHVSSLTDNSTQKYEDVVIQSTLQYIDTFYREANLSKIAEDFHQPLSALSKMIKKHTGHTFQEHLQRKRFQKAVMLLLESSLSVEEIAAAVGYENQSYFHRQFKSRYGTTPGKYRVEHKEDGKIRI